ncbi:cupin domain-containing protein [Thauera sp. Sel9]|uniref:cupin domain-containing protein n=1 Tax=Thauera sp. Sel9 TaxID=2974299 RepID=UPI0021E11CA5|nr:cupin domain-containing protein [Thauera sp. Sel9]
MGRHPRDRRTRRRGAALGGSGLGIQAIRGWNGRLASIGWPRPAGQLEDGGVDLAFNVLPAKRSVRFPAHHGGVEEHLYVHEGTLTVTLDETPFVVSAGDTLFFPSDCIHEFRNETDEPTSFLIVIDDRSKR